MTDLTTLSPLIGGMGHIKLHIPTAVPCPFRSSAISQFKAFNSLNTAFQQATGWELSLQETDSSYRHRERLDNPDFPSISRMSIWDLSPMLPPGIPAVSRIYCEKLLDELNKLLDELGHCRRQIYDVQDSTESGPSSARSISQMGEGVLAPLPNIQAYHGSNFALTPLCVDANRAACDWHIEPGGLARFAVFYCLNQETNSTRELIAAKSTFQAECRHGVSNLEIYQAIEQTVLRFFEGTEVLNAVIGAMNPLTGDVTFAGNEEFVLGTTMTSSKTSAASRIIETAMHLPRGQHVTISRWNNSLDDQEIQDWMDGTLRAMNKADPASLANLFECRIKDSMPSLPSAPALTLALSR